MIYVSLCGPEVSGPFDLFTVVTYPNNARDGYKLYIRYNTVLCPFNNEK